MPRGRPNSTIATLGRISRLAMWPFSMRRTDEAVEEFQRALDLNPNFAAAHGYLALALAFDGQSDQAIAHREQAIRMSPHDPQNAIFNLGISGRPLSGGPLRGSGCMLGRKAMQQRTEFTSGHRIYVASLAQAGQIDEARDALSAIERMYSLKSRLRGSSRYVPYTPARWRNSSKACARPGWNRFKVCILMSAFGTKRTCAGALHMSAFGSKADIEI